MAGFLGNQPPVVPMTSADIVDGTVTADDLNSTLNLSSKTVTLPASSVTSHVTSFDDSDIRSDILKLALSQAVDGNRVAFNLEDSFVDGFEDDTGITTETTVDRDTTSEYVNSTQPATATSSSSSEWNGGTSSFTFSGTTITSNTGNVAIRTNDTFAGDCKLEHTVTTANDKMVFGFYEISEDGTFSASAGRGGMDSMTNSWFWRSEGTDAIYYGGANQASQAISDGSTVKIERLSGVWKLYVGGSVVHTWSQQSTNTVRIVFSVDGPSASSVYSNVSWTDITDTTISSTGTLISDPQTASTSRTSASGVIIYEDALCTSTLGTDLKIYFSCDNSAWTEASSYGTATTYSGTKKLVKLGATTCTAGTSVAMKAEWANQSTSSGTTKTITANGDAQHSTSQNKIGSSSMYFDGTGDYLSIPTNSDFNFGSSLWTVEFWYKSVNSGVNSLVCLGDWDGLNGPVVIYQSSDGDLGTHYNLSTGVISNESSGTTAIDTGDWVHIAVSRTSATTIKAFVNGTEDTSVGETISSSATMTDLTTPLTIGRMPSRSNYDLTGYIDEIRVSDTARYTANFTPSTTAFTSDANTVLLIHSDTSNASTTFTDSSAVVGKEARLHGWAVNY